MPSANGYIITSRCEICPYAHEPLVGELELQPSLGSLEKLRQIIKEGRKGLLLGIIDVQTASIIGSVIKDFELLISLVGLDKIKQVIEKFYDRVSLKEVA